MACPYYRKPTADELTGRCGDDLMEVPSREHQNCLCGSHSGLYTNFCPIYAKLQQQESHIHKRGFLNRVFRSRYRKLICSDELGQQMSYQTEPEKIATQKEATALKV